MTTPLNIGLIGLGVMGQRMLTRLAAHPRLRAHRVWDADPAALARTLAADAALAGADSADALIADPDLHGLYIATPPAAHMALSHAAFDAGLAVLCEKPLTVDFDAADRVIERIAREQHRAAVNFSLASSHGLATLQSHFGAGSNAPLGPLQSVHIELEFAAWPRPWQAEAGAWLSQRAEGGFAREVLSHFVFVLQRVLGPASVRASAVVYPDDALAAETALDARLQVGPVVVTIQGRVDAAVEAADRNRMTWTARDGAIELRDWFGLTQQRRGAAEPTRDDAAASRTAGQNEQLDQWVRMIERQPHRLPDFGEALAVQATIEALLRAR